MTDSASDKKIKPEGVWWIAVYVGYLELASLFSILTTPTVFGRRVFVSIFVDPDSMLATWFLGLEPILSVVALIAAILLFFAKRIAFPAFLATTALKFLHVILLFQITQLQMPPFAIGIQLFQMAVYMLITFYAWRLGKKGILS